MYYACHVCCVCAVCSVYFGPHTTQQTIASRDKTLKDDTRCVFIARKQSVNSTAERYIIYRQTYLGALIDQFDLRRIALRLCSFIVLSRYYFIH